MSFGWPYWQVKRDTAPWAATGIRKTERLQTNSHHTSQMIKVEWMCLHNYQLIQWASLSWTEWVTRIQTKQDMRHTCIPPIADPMSTPHLVLSNSFMTSSVSPPSVRAFFPAVSKYSMNLSMRLANFAATHPSVENDFISPAILWKKQPA